MECTIISWVIQARATYTQNILLRIRTVFPNSNRIPSNTMKHSKRHTPDSFSKKINIDQLRTMMIICHWNILVWPQIFESACDANTTVRNGFIYSKNAIFSSLVTVLTLKWREWRARKIFLTEWSEYCCIHFTGWPFWHIISNAITFWLKYTLAVFP